MHITRLKGENLGMHTCNTHTVDTYNAYTMQMHTHTHLNAHDMHVHVPKIHKYMYLSAKTHRH